MAKNSNTYVTFNINEKTPQGFYKQLDDEFHFDFDPCPSALGLLKKEVVDN